MFNRCYVDEFIQYVQFLLIHLININCVFSPFYSCTLKRSMKPVIYQVMHFLFENNLIFNMKKLTFLASESLELVQKTLHLKDISFPQLLIPTKRYL